MRHARDKSGRAHHARECLRLREAADRFHQIAIGFGIADDSLRPSAGMTCRRIEVVERVEAGDIHRGEFLSRQIARRSAARDRPRRAPLRSRGTLRMPNAMVTASKLRSANGSASALASVKVIRSAIPRDAGSAREARPPAWRLARACPTASISALISHTTWRGCLFAAGSSLMRMATSPVPTPAVCRPARTADFSAD